MTRKAIIPGIFARAAGSIIAFLFQAGCLTPDNTTTEPQFPFYGAVRQAARLPDRDFGIKKLRCKNLYGSASGFISLGLQRIYPSSDLDLLAQLSDKALQKHPGVAGFVQRFDQLLFEKELWFGLAPALFAGRYPGGRLPGLTSLAYAELLKKASFKPLLQHPPR